MNGLDSGLDKVSLEILINRFQAVVDEMAQVIYRTAHTVFVKETQDYGAVLVSPKGEVFAAPRRYGVLMMIGMPMDDAIARMGDDVREGDIFGPDDQRRGLLVGELDHAVRLLVPHHALLRLWALRGTV